MESEKPPSRLPKRPEEFEALPPSPFCPLFVQKLLLAIIDAHPGEPNQWEAKTWERERQRRLNSTLEAIFGVAKRPGGKDFNFDRLVDIARRRMLRQISRDHHAEMYPGESNPLEVEDMAASIGAARAGSNRNTLKDRYNDLDFQEYASWLTMHYEHREEHDMLADLHRIGEILARWETALKIDPIQLGMASVDVGNPAE